MYMTTKVQPLGASITLCHEVKYTRNNYVIMTNTCSSNNSQWIDYFHGRIQELRKGGAHFCYRKNRHGKVYYST